MVTSNSIELLAPAGCFASLQAGIDAGADAVYFGLAQLNMRARARRSFEVADLGEIISRCHQHQVKGYLTLNTLLYDHDLLLARKLLETAAAHQVDAVIVSDFAAIQIAQALGLEIHLSTQLSISNYPAFKFYSQFSDRIVLARELTLPMIRKIHEQIVADDLRGPSGRLMEIEAFAHGALCIAVSGRCGMSLFTSNASANRGACEQNCRKEYEVVDKETGQKLLIDNNFVMSPNDIATIDFLDEFLASGVSVLKIEGRGRSPEYVSTVIATYRKAISAIQNGTFRKESTQHWLEDLNKVYNRGLSSGYYLGRPQGWSKAYGSKATRRKQLVGPVTHYYPKAGVIDVECCDHPLKIGDEYVLIGTTTGVIQGVIEELHVDREPVSHVEPKTLFSMKIPEKARVNDRLYWMEPLSETAAP